MTRKYTFAPGGRKPIDWVKYLPIVSASILQAPDAVFTLQSDAHRNQVKSSPTKLLRVIGEYRRNAVSAIYTTMAGVETKACKNSL